MKHKRLTALVLAAALVLAGCGGTKSSSGSAAASQSTGSSQNAPAIAVQKERITEQFTLEKTVRNEWGSAQKLTIHVPQLVCDSPDAEYINDELAAMYAAEYRDYESYPQAEVSQDEWCPQTYIDWDAYWYGDCVSLVVSSYYGGTDPIYSQGWCFDFAAGHKLSVTELLMRMGLDPDETQLAVYRAAIQTFDRNMVQQEYYDSLRESGMLSGMRADTLRDNGLENLTVLLKKRKYRHPCCRIPHYRRQRLAAAGGGASADPRRPCKNAGAYRYLRKRFGAAGRRHPHRYHQTHPRDHRMGRGL